MLGITGMTVANDSHIKRWEISNINAYNYYCGIFVTHKKSKKQKTKERLANVSIKLIIHLSLLLSFSLFITFVFSFYL